MKLAARTSILTCLLASGAAALVGCAADADLSETASDLDVPAAEPLAAGPGEEGFTFGPFEIGTFAGKCVAVGSASHAAGGHIIQWPCNQHAEQSWNLEPYTWNGYKVYRIRNVGSGMCIGVAGASQAAGTKLIQWPCSATALNHFWYLGNGTGGNYNFINVDTNLFMAVGGASPANAAALIQWGGNGHPDQDFDLF
jgi:hypothetical protein